MSTPKIPNPSGSISTTPLTSSGGAPAPLKSALKKTGDSYPTVTVPTEKHVTFDLPNANEFPIAISEKLSDHTITLAPQHGNTLGELHDALEQLEAHRDLISNFFNDDTNRHVYSFSKEQARTIKEQFSTLCNKIEQTKQMLSESSDVEEDFYAAHINYTLADDALSKIQDTLRMAAIMNPGHGLRNPGNTCCINAPLQFIKASARNYDISILDHDTPEVKQAPGVIHRPAFSAMPIFAKFLRNENLSEREVQQLHLEIKQLCTEFGRTDIADLIRDNGAIRTQQDATEILDLLMDRLSAPRALMQTKTTLPSGDQQIATKAEDGMPLSEGLFTLQLPETSSADKQHVLYDETATTTSIQQASDRRMLHETIADFPNNGEESTRITTFQSVATAPSVWRVTVNRFYYGELFENVPASSDNIAPDGKSYRSQVLLDDAGEMVSDYRGDPVFKQQPSFDLNGVRKMGPQKMLNCVTGVRDNITVPAADGDVTYEPTAILCHIGDTLTHGHYITYRKENGTWMRYDDQVISEATEEDFRRMEYEVYGVSYNKIEVRE